MNYGVTDTGFVKKDITVIKAELEALLKALFGDNINVDPDSTFGQFIGTFSKQGADFWDGLEQVYHSQYPNTADGVSLDNVAAINAITRKAATETFVESVLFGTEGTVVTAGSQAELEETSEIFELRTAVTISALAAVKAECSVPATGGADYTVTINTSTFTGSGASITAIVAAIVADITAGSEPVEATDNLDGSFTIVSNDAVTSFSVSVGTDVDLDSFGSYGIFDAVIAGATPVPVGTLTIIVTPISGWNSVDNLLIGQIGTDVETDVEFRLRRLNDLAAVNAATLDAIRSRISNDVEGVSQVIVLENRTDIVDSGGRPPHSFEAVVVGGESQDIGEKIWEVKPAGIATHKNTDPTFGISVNVTDSEGNIQIVNFSRPETIIVQVASRLTLYSEESFPIGGNDAVREAILAYGQELNIGNDLLIQRWYTPIFTVPGIGSAEIWHAITPTSTPLDTPWDPADPTQPNPGGVDPLWLQTDIPIGSTAIADFSLDRIFSVNI